MSAIWNSAVHARAFAGDTIDRDCGQRVYRAFLEADAMAKRLPPHGFTGEVHRLDARAGGTHRMSFTNFTSGNCHSFGGKYLELKPNELIRYTVQESLAQLATLAEPEIPG